MPIAFLAVRQRNLSGRSWKRATSKSFQNLWISWVRSALISWVTQPGWNSSVQYFDISLRCRQLVSSSVTSRCILGLPSNTTSSKDDSKCHAALWCVIRSVKRCSLLVNRDQFHRQMKENSKHRNNLFNKWLEILATEGKTAAARRAVRSFDCSCRCFCLSIKKCFCR